MQAYRIKFTRSPYADFVARDIQAAEQEARRIIAKYPKDQTRLVSVVDFNVLKMHPDLA